VVGEYNRHKYITGKEEEETPQFSDVTPLSTDDGNDVAAAVDPFSWPLFVAFAKCSASVSISIVLLLAFSNFMAPSTYLYVCEPQGILATDIAEKKINERYL
jgi:hypothetical protein